MTGNNQPLSPQGYNLGGEPYNKNPFWDDADPMLTGMVPNGGKRGQVLGKLSDSDQDTGWIDQTGGGGGSGEDGGYYYPNIDPEYYLHFVKSKPDMPEPPAPVNVRGPQGEPGKDGKDGAPGERGPVGDPGAPGPAGPAGETGPVGPAGPAGKDGAPGPAGPAGPEGPTGPTGPKGDPGATGERGPEGPAGPTGPAGSDGKDGAPGERGPAGPTGPKGPAGPEGPRGPAGETGPAGADGAVGPRGPEGPAGPAGPEGPAGKDAQLPAGTLGDLLVHNGTTWEARDAADALSPGGRNGDIATYEGGAVNWDTPARAMGMAGGTAGQVWTNRGDGSAGAWADAPGGGGGGAVETETFEVTVELTPAQAYSAVPDAAGIVSFYYRWTYSPADVAALDAIAPRLIQGKCRLTIPLTSYNDCQLEGSVVTEVRGGETYLLFNLNVANTANYKSSYGLLIPALSFRLWSNGVLTAQLQMLAPGQTDEFAVRKEKWILTVTGVAFKK